MFCGFSVVVDSAAAAFAVVSGAADMVGGLMFGVEVGWKKVGVDVVVWMVVMVMV